MPFGAFRSTTLGGSVGAGNGGNGGITEMSLVWSDNPASTFDFGHYLEINSTKLMVANDGSTEFSSNLFRIYDVASGTELTTFHPSTRPITSTTSTEDYIFFGFEGGVDVFDWSGNLLNTIDPPTGYPSTANFGLSVSANDFLLNVSDKGVVTSDPSDGVRNVYDLFFGPGNIENPGIEPAQQEPCSASNLNNWPQVLYSDNKTVYGADFSSNAILVSYANGNDYNVNSGYSNYVLTVDLSEFPPGQYGDAQAGFTGRAMTSADNVLFASFDYFYPFEAGTKGLLTFDPSTQTQGVLAGGTIPELQNQNLEDDRWGSGFASDVLQPTVIASSNDYVYIGAPSGNIDGNNFAGYVTILKKTDFNTYDVHTALFRPSSLPTNTGAQFGHTIVTNGAYTAISAPGDELVFVYQALGS